ncbi:hypothetical protein JTB14_018894 [Gonioctena quinquepunctata]|nr:hypothetical protein JTB14_018894 [Gonioctena quinquepunctata]
MESCEKCLMDQYLDFYEEKYCEHVSCDGTSGIGSESDDNDQGNMLDLNEILRVGNAYTEGNCFEQYDGKKLDVLENGFTIGNAFWFAIGSLMQQGSDLNPKVVNHF